MELMGRLTAMELAVASLIATHPQPEKLREAILGLGKKVLSSTGEVDEDFAYGMNSVLEVVTVAPE